MKPQKAEILRDDPYLGPDASYFKPWKLAIWIALLCSCFVIAVGAYQVSTGKVVRINGAGPQIPVGLAVFFQRLSVVFLVGFLATFLVRRSVARKERFLAVFYSIPMWRAHFENDELDARVSRRILNVNISMWGTLVAMLSAFPWVLAAFYWSSD
jgi:hypothetical protein